jgi:hypothetical protein
VQARAFDGDGVEHDGLSAIVIDLILQRWCAVNKGSFPQAVRGKSVARRLTDEHRCDKYLRVTLPQLRTAFCIFCLGVRPGVEKRQVRSINKTVISINQHSGAESMFN